VEELRPVAEDAIDRGVGGPDRVGLELGNRMHGLPMVRAAPVGGDPR
jgi:hypothetical protein